MAILAIKGHRRGEDVIQLLEMLGGKNPHMLTGYIGETKVDPKVYFIDNGTIHWNYISCLENDGRASEMKIFTLEEFLEKYPYKVGDKVKAWINGYCGIHTINEIQWDRIPNEIKYKIGNYWYSTSNLQPHKEQDMDKEKFPYEIGTRIHVKADKEKKRIATIVGISYNSFGNKEYEIKFEGEDIVIHYPTELMIPIQEEQIIIDIPKGYKFVDTIGGKIVLERIEPQYPKTYEECCKVVNASPYVHLVYNISDGQTYSYDVDNLHHYEKIRKLRICRDAYWKLYGEQTGLDKPWEPTSDCEIYNLYRKRNVIYKGGACWGGKCNILEFPTEEMRDEFYENFKDSIEECKELL